MMILETIRSPLGRNSNGISTQTFLEQLSSFVTSIGAPKTKVLLRMITTSIGSTAMRHPIITTATGRRDQTVSTLAEIKSPGSY
ncbi:hypothetical protein RHMOL_Rhmol04G0286500 [Rhododendron molle]|uniref:Uncharacterized protein n=1 Tax=Rhododendron molle TaxID=49168 RepID=A0ACC0P6K8_RHOML|nr:hypothetical protein RHMOL_Rhmol04G0286500 [Rhododendron molle]